MLFNSLAFLFIFLPVVLIATYLVPRKKRNALLLVASVLFMLFACGTNFKSAAGLVRGLISVDFWMLVGYVVLGYFCALGMKRQKKQGGKKAILITALILEAIPLVLYKVMGSVPLGLSFYTFQSVSYLADVYTGKAPAEKSFTKYAVYLSCRARSSGIRR